jgi:subtilisin family serine protease
MSDMTGHAGTAPVAPAIRPRDRHFLIAKQDAFVPAGVDPITVDALVERLAQDPEVTVERTIAPQGVDLLADAPTPLQRIVVATMSTEKARELDEHPQVLIEEDFPVHPLPMPLPEAVEGEDPITFIPFGGETRWQLVVTGADGTPAAGAAVYLYGSGVPAQGRTGADGRVEIGLLNESDDTLRALFVNPQHTYWNLWWERPRLSSSAPNQITLVPLSDTLAGFPDRQTLGWGQQAMRLGQLDGAKTGAGVRVAVIDSGAAPGHPDLATISRGRDLTVVPAAPTGWEVDTIAHGSHCSGVIAGSDSASGIRGFAPAVEVHELRIFPGGRVSSVLDALDYCLETQIDVVNMSLGSGGRSDLMLAKLAQAKRAGVACIVAAGNAGGEVQFPGSSPEVLTVAAVGKTGEFPAESMHARQVWTEGRIDNGVFAAKFSCHGPEVDVCAPGVAIVSSVPDRGYAAWDGTSMATPHVSGLAALLLAHHGDFMGRFRTRDASRVDRLFEILKNSATRCDVGDPERTGAGVPDAVRAFSDASGPRDTGTPPAAADYITRQLEQLRQEFVTAGLL